MSGIEMYQGLTAPAPPIGTADALAEVRESTIPGAGLGLFARQLLPKGTRVTYYDGVLVDHKAATRLPRSHLCTLVAQHQIIDGLRTPVPGRGGSSFVNDGIGVRGRNNCVRQLVWTHCTPWMVLVTTRDVPAGGELFHSYGNTYWKMHLPADQVGAADAVSAASPSAMQQELGVA